MAIRIVSPSFKIKQYDTDPSTIAQEKAWVLRNVGAAATTSSTPMGLLLVWTYGETTSGAATSYQFSYKTKEDTTKRVSIT